MRKARTAAPKVSENKAYTRLVYAGVDRLPTLPSKRPKTCHLYFQVDGGWQENPVLGTTRTFTKRIGSSSVGAVHRVECAPSGEPGSLRLYPSTASWEGFWPAADDVMRWQARARVAEAEVAAWETRQEQAENFIRAQLEPLKKAMRGMTRNQRAVFLSMVLTELSADGVLYF